MIIDAHLHVWRSDPRFPDPGVTIVSPLCDVPIEVLRSYMDEHGVARAVLVQPVYPGEDNSYVADCAAAAPETFAAVCVVDPRRSEAAERLEYWNRERGCRGLRLRPRVPAEGADFGAASTYTLWERAESLGVVINLLASPEHLVAIADLANRFAGAKIIIDHMAHPDVGSGVDGEAFRRLLALSRQPNVFVKPTGYYYSSREDYPYRDCWDLVRALYDAFGAERLLWGSDFPHVLLKSGYRRCLRLQERFYTFLRPHELDAIMGGTAASLYWQAND